VDTVHECDRQTDRRTDRETDRQTDRITITNTVQRIASHGKKIRIFLTGGAYAPYAPCLATPLQNLHALYLYLCGSVVRGLSAPLQSAMATAVMCVYSVISEFSVYSLMLCSE